MTAQTPATEQVIELVIRVPASDAIYAEHILADIRYLLAGHYGLDLDAAAIIPSGRYDAELDIEGAPA